ncbi:MAG TPA: hypothetical protein VFY66_15840 [Anaerolineales bacterium]|nr:hypothetical protein [Anaerolineales bacterium]
MNAAELKQRLLEEGCSPYNFSIGPGGSDVYCLDGRNGVWQVFYTERGKHDTPIFETSSEAEACEFYFDYITKKIRHNHLVGFFISEQKASDLESQLARLGIPAHRDKIPYGGWTDPRYRVFVVGKDIFRARVVLGEVPLKDSQ